MNLITIEQLEKSYTEKPLFTQASFYLEEGDKVGIIGINGTGKSTLLKIIAGLEEPDQGTVTKANHVIIRYLPQHPVFQEGQTVLEAVLEGNVTEENSWSVEADAKSMLHQLGIQEFSALAEHLSGGQKKRLALASALLSSADILVLDEPTNHLDGSMAEWLEQYLKKSRAAFVMVTHDRYFLDAVCNRIVEIDKCSLYGYKTNYEGYLELKAEREEMTQATERKRQSILRTELEWVKRGARARSTKQKARLERYEELKNQKGLEEEQKVEIQSISSRLGRTTIELNEISKSYDKPLITEFTYTFLKTDRIGIVGDNGSGKTTLLRMIAGLEQLDSGSITVGQTVQIGYYAQEIQDTAQKGELAYMDPEKRVIDYIRDTAEYVRTEDGLVSASQMLERFLFPGEKQYSLIGKLSGGEKRRLNLLRVLMEAPNVLLLDEPTNDLDIQTLSILEDYLAHFAGIVVTVSHDRYFLDRVVSRIFAVEGEGVVHQYEGGWTDYYEKARAAGRLSDGGVSVTLKNTSKNVEERVPKAKQSRTHQKKLKLSYKEQKDYETIEETISGLEERLTEIEQQIGANASDFVKLGQLMQEKEATEARLEEKMEYWTYLMELVEKIEAQKG